MALDMEQIRADLNRRFAEPLPEFYKRRVIVWKDEEREYADSIGELTLDSAKVAVLSENNNFAVKKLICFDDAESNYLLYVPVAFDVPDENWLIDLMLYSEEYYTDQITSIMEELHIPLNASLRREVKAFRTFFRAQSRRKPFAALGNPPVNAAQLQLGVMAVLSEADKAKPNQIMRKVLQGGLDAAENPVYQAFCAYGADKPFWNMVAQGTGFKTDSADLSGFAKHLLLTAVTRTLHTEYLSGLEKCYSEPYQAYCYDLVTEWLHDTDNESLRSIAETVENELQLTARFLKAQVRDLLDTEIFPSVHEVILAKLMRSIDQQRIDVNLIRTAIEKRRTCVGYQEYSFYYNGILAVADMQQFFTDHAAGFHTSVPKEVWREYTEEYYKMDSYYRRFHDNFDESQKHYHPDLKDLFHSVMKKAEALYSGWYLGQLGNNWSDACADDLRDFGKISGVPEQTDFYRERISSSTNRIYVIISDALRYEVAVELADDLRREMQAEVSVSSMQAIFPTVTKFGMAALLPHDKLSVELKTGKTDRIAVLADGQSTEANNRDKLLKAANPQSVVLKYSDILEQPNKQSRQALVKGMDVIYIYHDTIDEAGHLESSIFSACTKANAELKNLIRIITGDFGSANILVTADHGFLYTHDALSEADKADKLIDSDAEIETARRYMIVKDGAAPEYLLPVRFLDGKTGYSAFTPRENIRIRMKGAGLNFVHGGISLQEMVVPVVEYHFLRNQYKEYQQNRSKYDTKPVTISLLSASHKICNMIFSLNFYQKEAVGGNLEKATYQLCFVDSTGKPISDIATLIADKTSENVQERSFRCTFTLKPLKYSNTESYYLTISDENGMEISREEFQIDIAFAVEQFDFFS